MVEMKKRFNWKITAKKFAINTLIVVLAGIASIYGDSPYYLAAIPMIKAKENIIKHY
jgi:hypothetical protein